MALPTSRNTTYAASSPVLSVDLNALEDCIIGNKHPTLEMCLDASVFKGDSLALGTMNAAGYLSSFSAAGIVRAGVPIPVGKRIISVEVFYSINGSAANLTPKLRKQILSTAVQADVVAGSADNTGAAGVIESQLLTANHVVLTGNTYFIEVSVTNSLQRIYGAKVLFDSL
jgi:hypothetical protein